MPDWSTISTTDMMDTKNGGVEPVPTDDYCNEQIGEAVA